MIWNFCAILAITVSLHALWLIFWSTCDFYYNFLQNNWSEFIKPTNQPTNSVRLPMKETMKKVGAKRTWQLQMKDLHIYVVFEACNWTAHGHNGRLCMDAWSFWRCSPPWHEPPVMISRTPHLTTAAPNPNKVHLTSTSVDFLQF